jgi:hypothetical protein
MAIASGFKALNALRKAAKAAPRDEALALAQYRASLPVEQGGLGLPPGNTAMERADIMFPESLYHATHQDFGAFDLKRAGSGTTMNPTERAVFMTDKPAAADEFIAGPYYQAGDQVARHYAEGANVMPLRAALNPDVWEMSGGMYHAPFVAGAIKEAKREGADSVVFNNMRDPGIATAGRPPLSNVVAGLEPKNIRSRFAAFDPFRRHESDLLAGLAPYVAPAAGLGLASAAMAPGEAEAGQRAKPDASPYASMMELKKKQRLAEELTHTPRAPMSPGGQAVRSLALEAMNPAAWPLFGYSRELGRPEDLRLVDGQWRSP